MRVFAVPGDTTGCGHYRLIYPVKALREQGFDAHIVSPGERIPADGTDCVVVLQRPTDWEIPEQTIPALRAMGYAVVVEVDDLLSRLQSTHTVRALYDPRKSDVNWTNLERSAAMADLVTVTTPKLAEFYGAHGRVAVLPNMVPGEQIASHPRSPTEARYIGWTGNVHTHPKDLDVCQQGLRRNLRKPWRFKTIGHVDTLRYLGIYDGDVVEWLSIEYYLAGMREFDIGLAPLEINEFNASKSELKPLEWMASGVACIASPTAPYLALADESQACVVAETRKDWYRQIKRLMADDEARRQLAEAGIAYAKTRTYEENAWRWWGAWAQARVNYQQNYIPSVGRLIPKALTFR